MCNGRSVSTVQLFSPSLLRRSNLLKPWSTDDVTSSLEKVSCCSKKLFSTLIQLSSRGHGVSERGAGREQEGWEGGIHPQRTIPVSYCTPNHFLGREPQTQHTGVKGHPTMDYYIDIYASACGMHTHTHTFLFLFLSLSLVKRCRTHRVYFIAGKTSRNVPPLQTQESPKKTSEAAWSA